MKKILALVMAALLMCLSFAGCSKIDPAKDVENIKEKGKIVVGITEFAPMDYKEKGSTEWIGFDADMAKKFAEELGVEVEFQLIDWNNKIMELQNGTIDCVWNGMTLTDEVKAGMSCSVPYCINSQVVVVKAADADKYQTAETCKGLKFAVEEGSAGEDMAKENGFEYTAVADMATALAEVKSGTSDAAIIDSLMAGAMIGEGTSYEDLTYTAKLNNEEYGVGFRVGSNLVDEFNAFLEKATADGTVENIAKTYGVQEAIVK